MNVSGKLMSSKNCFVIKSVKNVFFFVLTFVAIFLELIIVQHTFYAHFNFFLCNEHKSNNKAACSSRRVVMDPFLIKAQKITFFGYKTNNIFGSNYLPEEF